MRIARALAALPLVLAVSIPAVVAPAPAVGQTFGSELCDTVGVEQFRDVQAGDYAADYILCMRALGLSQGRGNGNYGADRLLTRGQMATFLVRLWTDVLNMECPDGVTTPFTDIAGTTHADSIDCIYGLRITAGTTATTYSPQDALKASQISRFLFRTYEKVGSTCPAAASESELDRAVSCLLDRRVVPTGAEAAAATPVTRSQMAVYVIGLWHNVTGRGLPPAPPQFNEPGTITEETTESQPVTSYPRIIYVHSFASRYPSTMGSVNIDGTAHQIHAANFTGTNTEWSPDRSRLAYPVFTENSTNPAFTDYASQLWVAGDGTNPRHLAENVFYNPGNSHSCPGAPCPLRHVGWFGVTWSPDSSRLAYSRSVEERGQRLELWVVNGDGSQRRKLANDTITSPWWSPDSNRLAYQVVTDNSPQLWITDIHKGIPYKVTDNVLYYPPGSNLANKYSYYAYQHYDKQHSFGVTWSPDGNRLAYAVASDWYQTGHETELWMADGDGRNTLKLADDGGGPWWSPDGRHLAYRVGSGGAGELWLVNADGTDSRKVSPTSASFLTWSPSSDRLAYIVDDLRGNYQLWLVDADGTSPRKVSDTHGPGGGGIDPVWSRDGNRLAYMAYGGPGDGFQLWVVNADGTNARKIASPARSASWSPDGNHLTYDKSEDGGWDNLWMVNSDGTGAHKLADNAVSRGWSPDSDHLIYSVWSSAIGGDDLWVVDSDGTNARMIADAAYFEGWSPDGRYLAYQVFVGHTIYSHFWRVADGTQLWIADGDGTNQRMVLNWTTGRLYDVVFS